MICEIFVYYSLTKIIMSYRSTPTVIQTQGFLFFAKYIPDEIMKKHNLIRINIPIHNYLDTYTDNKWKIELFLNQDSFDGKYSLQMFLGKEYDTKWIDINLYDDLMDGLGENYSLFDQLGIEYMYIMVTDDIKSHETQITTGRMDPETYGSHECCIMHNIINMLPDEDELNKITGNDINGHFDSYGLEVSPVEYNIVVFANDNYRMIDGLTRCIDENGVFTLKLK